jgi:hypothetical protein
MKTNHPNGDWWRELSSRKQKTAASVDVEEGSMHKEQIREIRFHSGNSAVRQFGGP